MLNKVVLMGRIGHDLELRKTQSGISVTTIRLAVDRNYVDDSGDRETDWFDVVAWRGAADLACKYMTKGRQIVVEGELRERRWEDKDGNKRYSVEVVADNLFFADSNRQKKSEDDGASLPFEVGA